MLTSHSNNAIHDTQRSPTSSLGSKPTLELTRTEKPKRIAITDKILMGRSSTKETQAMKAATAHLKAIGEEEIEVSHVSHGNNLNLQDDTALVALLKACAKQRDLSKGSRLHADILERGLLKKNIFLGSTLIHMYARCGAFAKARDVLDELQIQNVVAWNALIAGYAQYGQGEEALRCFECMRYKGLPPDAVTFACILKACGSIGASEKGKEIHDEIARQGFLGKNVVLGNALVDMYAKCGALSKAQQVLDELPVRNVISWTALIAGYCQHGYDEDALNCFERMQHEGVSPNTITFTCILKVCSSIGAIDEGLKIHAEIARKKLENISVLGTALVDMYAKCGALTKAHQVFDELPLRDVVSWTALIAGYAQHGHGQEALDCFELMHAGGISPNAVTLANILKACSSIRAAEKGKAMHATIVREGFLRNDSVLGNALVDMYAKCGALTKAQEIFDELSVHDEVSWTALIVGYCQHGHGKKALTCFERMKHEGLPSDAMTLVSILQACGSIGATEKGQKLHVEIIRVGLVGKDHVLNIALLDMYAKCGALASAQQVFDEIPVRDVVSWNALITGYCQHGHGKKVLACVELMQAEGLSPDEVTLVCALQACGSIGAAEKGREIHAEIAREGLLQKYMILGNALMGMYVKCGALAKAEEVLDEVCVQDVVTWNVLIVGYCQNGLYEEALNCADLMQKKGLSADAVTFSCILKACGSLGAAERGKSLHVELVREGFLDKDSVLGNVLVDMFAKCGSLAQAQQVFNELPVKDKVSWTALISGYCQHGHSGEALDCFQWMQYKGPSLDVVTYICALKACGSTGAVDMGADIHAEIAREGILGKYSVLGSALVDMYAKCGALTKAQEVFDSLFLRDVVSWTALIAGYAQVGMPDIAIKSLRKMIREGVEPNLVTLTVMINACSSFGLLNEGQTYFESLSTDYSMEPTSEHYTCMVDLFGRAGHLDKAMAVIKKLPSSDHLPAWFVLLGACRKVGNVELGGLIFDNAVGMHEKLNSGI